MQIYTIIVPLDLGIEMLKQRLKKKAMLHLD